MDTSRRMKPDELPYPVPEVTRQTITEYIEARRTDVQR